MTRRITVAIDGPAGAGKSTVAKRLATRLSYALVDTGAMYRAVALLALARGASLEDETALVPVAQHLPISFRMEGDENRVFLNGEDISSRIRTPEVSRGASLVSRFGLVRAALLGLQRDFAAQGGVVMEGRDIGTVVCPNAEAKFFLTASVEERARRRHQELLAAGHSVDLGATQREVEARDLADSSRPVAPLRQAEDAVLVDATARSVEDIVESMALLVESRAASR
jgi:cytidylate kinase